MDTSELASTPTTLFSEMVDGAPQGMAYMLNQGDAGLLPLARPALRGGGVGARRRDHRGRGAAPDARLSDGVNPVDSV